MQRLLNITAPNTAINVLSVNGVDSKSLTKLCDSALGCIFRVKPSYFPNLFICNLCVVVVIATAVTAAVLADTVIHIVLGVAEEQMVRVYTAPVITPVANLHSIWDWSKCFYECEPVAAFIFFEPFNFSISRGIERTSPVPAAIVIEFRNPGPKSQPERLFEFFCSCASCFRANILSCHVAKLSTVDALSTQYDCRD